MKLLGFLIIVVNWFLLSEEFSWVAMGWLVFGIFLVAVEEWAQLFARTVRYIHKDKQ